MGGWPPCLFASVWVAYTFFWLPVGSISDVIFGWTCHFVKCALLTEVWRRGEGVGDLWVASRHVQTLGVLCLGGKPHLKPD